MLAAEITISADTRQTAGVLLLTIVAVQFGGWYLLRIVTGKVGRTEFQEKFERAGHAHAGVLIILSLVALLYADAANLTGLAATVARNGIPIAAILLPAGFFFAAAGRRRIRPNALIVLVYLGILSLAAGVITLGWSLLTS